MIPIAKLVFYSSLHCLNCDQQLPVWLYRLPVYTHTSSHHLSTSFPLIFFLHLRAAHRPAAKTKGKMEMDFPGCGRDDEVVHQAEI